MIRSARPAVALAAVLLLVLALALEVPAAVVTFQSWPVYDGFDGGPVATRYVNGQLVVLPGARGPGDPGYDPTTGPTGSVGSLGDPIQVLSWNVLAASIAAGAAPTAMELGGPASVWVPEPGLFADCQDDGSFQLCWDWPFAVDPRGNLGGSATLDLSGSIRGVPISGTLRGGIRGKLRRRMRQRITRADVKVGLVGIVHVGGVPVPARFKIAMRGRLFPDGRVCDPTTTDACLFGRMTLDMRMKIPGRRRVRDRARVPLVALVPRDEGTWTLDLAVAGSGKWLSGTAAGLFGDPAAPVVMPFAVGGRYDARRDRAALRLRPMDPLHRGNWVRLDRVMATAGDIQVAKARFKLFGQQGRTWIPAPCCTLP